MSTEVGGPRRAAAPQHPQRPFLGPSRGSPGRGHGGGLPHQVRASTQTPWAGVLTLRAVPRLPPPSSSLGCLPQCSHPILPVPHPPDLGPPAQPISHLHFRPYFHCLRGPPPPQPRHPASLLIPSSSLIWSVSPFPKMGSLLAFARLLLLPPASFLSPTLSSLGACGRGEVLCPFLFGTASPCPSLTLCTLVCLQSPRYTPSWQFLPSNLLLLRPHWGVGGGSWGDSQGLREHVKMLPLGGAGGQHLGGASRPQIRQ